MYLGKLLYYIEVYELHCHTFMVDNTDIFTRGIVYLYRKYQSSANYCCPRQQPRAQNQFFWTRFKSFHCKHRAINKASSSLSAIPHKNVYVFIILL